MVQVKRRMFLVSCRLASGGCLAPMGGRKGVRAMRLEGKVAIVVGAGQTAGETIGNGRATAVLLAREGARVVVVDRDLASAEETAAMIRAEDGEALAGQADATNEDNVKAMVAFAVARFGYVDILHNNVGASIALGDARGD